MTDSLPITVTGTVPYCPPETLVLDTRGSFEGYMSPFWYLAAERARPLVEMAQDPVLRAIAEALWNWADDDGIWSILDVGCEDGWMLRRWKDWGYRVLGITSRPDNLPEYAIVEDMHTFDRTRMGLFDAVWLFYSLEHALVPLVVLRNVHRHLRPGGRLWIALHLKEPNLTPWQIRSLIAQAGFTVSRGDVRVIEKETSFWLECSR